jgi:ribosomal-protein-alanine N-acetyltransferase
MKNQMTILETKRLRLKHLEASDVSVLIDLWTDPVVTEYLSGPRDRDKLIPFFEEELKDPFAETFNTWPLIEKQTGKVIGYCGLLDKEVAGTQEIEVIYIIGASAWGNGYATEIGSALVRYAHEEMGIKRLIALIEPENEASERVAAKIGMSFEKEVVRLGGGVRKVYSIDVDSGKASGK